MAGPLTLDNYELEANESGNDELVITHTPTGKTTTLSEDTFRAIAAEELSVSNVGFRAELSSDQSIANNTVTKVAFDSTRYDDTGEFDAANSKFVADNDGTYAVTASVYWLGGDTGSKHTTYIYKNGSQQLKERGLESYSHSVTGTVRLAAGDVLECYVRQQTGVSEDIVKDHRWTYFVVSQVA